VSHIFIFIRVTSLITFKEISFLHQSVIIILLLLPSLMLLRKTLSNRVSQSSICGPIMICDSGIAYFWVNFEPYWSEHYFWCSWGSIEIWLEPKAEPPSGNLACPNPWNSLYVKMIKLCLEVNKFGRIAPKLHLKMHYYWTTKVFK